MYHSIDMFVKRTWAGSKCMPMEYAKPWAGAGLTVATSNSTVSDACAAGWLWPNAAQLAIQIRFAAAIGFHIARFLKEISIFALGLGINLKVVATPLPFCYGQAKACPTDDTGRHGSAGGVRFSDNGVKRGFGLSLAVEQQGIVGAAPRGKVVQPGMGVGNAPESDARDGVAVLQEDAKQGRVASGKRLLLRGRQ